MTNACSVCNIKIDNVFISTLSLCYEGKDKKNGEPEFRRHPNSLLTSSKSMIAPNDTNIDFVSERKKAKSTDSDLSTICQ